MTVTDTYKVHMWMVNTIRQSGKLSLSRLRSLWMQTEMSNGRELSRTTFFRIREDIKKIFGIRIDCDQHTMEYYIRNAGLIGEDTMQNWMLSTLSITNIVSECKDLHDRILLQQVPNDRWLGWVIDAMRLQVRLRVRYQRYGSDRVSEVDFEPYCLKLFAQRWYVLAHFHRDATAEREERDYFAVYSLDRIQTMEMTETHFELQSDFNAERYFGDCYGVVAGDGTPTEHILVRAYGQQRFYMADLPLHASQRQVDQGEDWTDFSYDLRPTMDFLGDLLSRGSQVQVMEPSSVAQRMRELLSQALQRYDEPTLTQDTHIYQP